MRTTQENTLWCIYLPISHSYHWYLAIVLTDIYEPRSCFELLYRLRWLDGYSIMPRGRMLLLRFICLIILLPFREVRKMIFSNFKVFFKASNWILEIYHIFDKGRVWDQRIYWSIFFRNSSISSCSAEGCSLTKILDGFRINVKTSAKVRYLFDWSSFIEHCSPKIPKFFYFPH